MESFTNKERLLKKLEALNMEMIHSPYGNYFIQTVLETSDAKMRENLVKDVVENIFSISNEKFSYNCVIKLLENGNKSEKKLTLLKLLNPERLLTIKRNKYLLNVVIKMTNYMSKNFLKYFIDLFNNYPKLESISSILYNKLNSSNSNDHKSVK